MIRNSFIFLPRVSPLKEQKIWTQGIQSWNDFTSSNNIDGVPKQNKPHFDRLIEIAKQNLYDENSGYFTDILPRSDHWRLYDFFKENACFLDIETTGYRGGTTVVGLYDGKDTKIFIRGQNLDTKTLQNEISKHKLLITFNGGPFDLPVLKQEYGINFTQPHIDLRFAAKKIGLSGGLKSIEKEIGIRRADEVSDITGADAVYLWRQYRTTGDKKYLDLLVQYNEEDIINLKQLADHVVPKLWAQTYSSLNYS